MNTKKLLTGAAVLGLGITGSVVSHLTFEGRARAQSAESNASEKTAQPGTRGESGRAGPMPSDGGARSTESEPGAAPEQLPAPEKAPAPKKATQPDKGSESSKPKTLKSPEGDSSTRDPIPPGPATVSPAHRGSAPW